MSLPFSEGAAFGGHAELGPSRASALAAAAGGVQRGGVPPFAGAAGGLAFGEDLGWGCGEVALGPVEKRRAEAGGLLREGWRCGFDLRRTLGRVFATLHANGASAVAGLAAVEVEGASVVFAGAGGDVRAGHDTVTE